MLVFIDDSGDPGFKLDGGSSKFFIIALVIFNDDLEAEKTALAVKELRREVGFPDDAEFKFSKSSKSIREKFLNRVTDFDFKVRAIVFDKSVLYSEELKNNRNSFYSYAIKSVLKNSAGSVMNARVKIDGSGDRVFRKTFTTYLRRELNSHEKTIVKNCRLVDSKSNVLVQLADMVAGSIHRFYQPDKSDSTIYKTIIKKHIESEWKFK